MDPKTIGIIAITAEGGALCYRTIVAESTAILPPQVHPPIVLHNPSLHLTNHYLQARDWPGFASIVHESIHKLVSIGAQIIVIPANSAHYAISHILPACPVPLVSIVETTADACMEHSYRRVAVLGIGSTMSDGLYAQPLNDRGIELIVPSEVEQAIVNRVIFDHIIPARVTRAAIQRVVAIMRDLKSRGANAVILGCTELPLVINDHNAPLPFIDTTRIQARSALKLACRQ